MKRLYPPLLLAIGILASTLGAICFIAIWPYLDIVGKLLIGFLAVVISCTATLVVTWTWFYIGIMAARKERERLHSRLIVAGDVVAWPQSDGSFIHLSAQHEAAKIPERVTVQEVKEPDQTEAIRIMLDDGMSQRDIAKELNISRNQVRKIHEQMLLGNNG